MTEMFMSNSINMWTVILACKPIVTCTVEISGRELVWKDAYEI